jgi:hypothetical protein
MKKRGTPTEAAGGVQMGVQTMWWCPICKALRHRASNRDEQGNRYHCWDGYVSKSDMFRMVQVQVTVEIAGKKVKV